MFRVPCGPPSPSKIISLEVWLATCLRSGCIYGGRSHLLTPNCWEGGGEVGEVGGKLEERVSELLSSVWDYCPAVPRETQGGKLASSQTAQNLDPPVKRSWQNNYLVKEVIYVCKATLYFSQRQLANKIIAKECSSGTRLQNSSRSALGVSIKNPQSGPTETL